MLNSDSRPNRRQALTSLAAVAAAPFVLGPFASAAWATAPQLGAWQPKFWRFKFGAFEFTTIADSEAFIDGPYPIIGKNAEESEVRKLMRENQVQEQRYQPGFSPTVVNTGKELVLFDTGNGANGFVPRPNGGWLAAQLGPSGFKAEDIDVVVLTHGHPDHVAGIIEGDKPLFPNARYVIAATEYDYWAPEGKHTGELEKLAAVFRANTKQVADRFKFLKPGDDVVSGIRSIDAPGHTPGHLAFMIESARPADPVLGRLRSPSRGVARLVLRGHCVFDIDREMAVTTRKRIYDMAATDRLPVIGYHMPFPSVGHVERTTPGSYRWIAHSFQLNE